LQQQNHIDKEERRIFNAISSQADDAARTANQHLQKVKEKGIMCIMKGANVHAIFYPDNT